MIACKGIWIVTAGVVANEPIPQYSRNWSYSNTDLAKDEAQAPNGKKSKFLTLAEQAHEYALSITNPTQVNWVRCEFVWV